MASWFVAILALAFGAQAIASPKVEEGFVTGEGGVRLYYQKAGGGGPVIIAPGRLFVFEELRALADRHTVIAYDMRNRGRSEPVKDGAQLGIGHDVRDLEAVRRHFNVPRAHLVGYSYLGLMVVLYAMEHPARVDRIVQLGPVPMKFGTQYPAALSAGGRLPELGAPADQVAAVEKELEAGGAERDPRGFCERLWAVQRYRLVGNPANVGKLGPGVCDMSNEWPVNLWKHFEHSMASIRAVDVAPARLAALEQPVLTIHGRKDRNAAYGAGREWAMKLPQARLVTLPEAAHQAISEYPDSVLAAMRTFLDGRWPVEAEKVTELEPRAIGPAARGGRGLRRGAGDAVVVNRPGVAM
jgi:pimeloyl-ACP methyl ester carboxylesterase